MGWEVENPYGKCRRAARKCLKNIGVQSSAEGFQKLAGRQGVSAAAFRNPHKHGSFLTSHSGQRFSVFEFFRRLSSVRFRFQVLPAQMTLEMSLAAKGFPSFLSENRSAIG